MDSLKNPLYEFIHLNCGFIAHYNLNGFKATYYSGLEFINFLTRLKDGCSVYACDLEDNYDYGFTNKEVKEALKQLITDDLIHDLKTELNNVAKQARYKEYQKLKTEFETGD